MAAGFGRKTGDNANRSRSDSALLSAKTRQAALRTVPSSTGATQDGFAAETKRIKIHRAIGIYMTKEKRNCVATAGASISAEVAELI